MKAVVFGASGMIGRYLVPALLESNYDVIAVDRANCARRKQCFADLGIENFQVDISNIDNFRGLPTKDIDVVIHLAGIMPATMRDYSPGEYFKVNTIGTLNILDYCKKISAHQFVFTTSHSDFSGYWGLGQQINPYASPKYSYGNDHSIYSISKRAAVEVIINAYREFGLQYNIFRCPNIYAWNSPDTYYVDGVKRDVGWKKLITKALKGENLEIWGDPKIKRDLVYIKDLLQMIILSLKCPSKNNIFNVSNGTSTTLEEQIYAIAKVFNPDEKKSKIIQLPETKTLITEHSYDITNAVKILGYRPKYFLYEMLEDIKKEIFTTTSPY